MIGLIINSQKPELNEIQWQLPEGVQGAVVPAIPSCALALVALRNQGSHYRQDQDHRGYRTEIKTQYTIFDFPES